MKRYLVPLFAGILASCGHARETTGTPIARHAVLVHGIFEDGTRLEKMKKRLESHGIECICPKLLHHDGTGGLDYLAEHLKQDIDRAFGSDKPIILIGFSMGGLVSRHYLQDLGGASRCATFITISSPHRGTNVAWGYYSKGAVQMRPGSEFLANLERTESRLGKIPVVSYRTPMDLIILPTESSVWERADNVKVPVAIHPLMVRSEKVLSDIERRILK
jgi:triacylglycerol lipase